MSKLKITFETNERGNWVCALWHDGHLLESTKEYTFPAQADIEMMDKP